MWLSDGDTEPSDYINASFISDVLKGTDRKYIAAQVGPFNSDPEFAVGSGSGSDTETCIFQVLIKRKILLVAEGLFIPNKNLTSHCDKKNCP